MLMHSTADTPAASVKSGPRSAAAPAELRPEDGNVLSYLLQRAAGQRQAGQAAATTTTKTKAA
jgi:hypothetical protein